MGDGDGHRREPRTDWLAGQVALDEGAFILTGPALGRTLTCMIRGIGWAAANATQGDGTATAP